MQLTATVEELLQVLKDRGLNESAVDNVQQGLWLAASEQFMGDLVNSFTPEDFQSVEASATQEEANQKMRSLYNEKTGKDMDEEMLKVVDQQAQELITKYKVEGDTMPVVSESTDQQDEKLLEAVAEDGRTDAPAGEEKKEEDTVHDLT